MYAQIAIKFQEERHCSKMPLHMNSIHSFTCGINWQCKLTYIAHRVKIDMPS